VTGRRFAAIHARQCLFELARYLRVGILPEELVRDFEIAVGAYGIPAREVGGGDA
jgi:hypothetical protein